MRLHILSDVHLEFAPFQPRATDAEVVILAGDVHVGTNGLRWALTAFPEVPVLYVLGNHEFYKHALPQLTQELKELAAGTSIRILENDRVELGGVEFLGATLWTDFTVNGNPALNEAMAESGISDFHLIRTGQSYRRFRPADARQLHVQSLFWLREQLKDTQNKKVVVITHHAPSPKSIGSRFAHDPLNPAFASNLESLMTENPVALWIHGHIHQSCDYYVGPTRVVANPRGYPDESDIGFRPALVIDI